MYDERKEDPQPCVFNVLDKIVNKHDKLNNKFREDQNDYKVALKKFLKVKRYR